MGLFSSFFFPQSLGRFQLLIRFTMCYLQISSFAMENKRLVQKLQENNIDWSALSEHGSTGKGEEFMLSKRGSSTLTYSGEIVEEVAETSSITSKVGLFCSIALTYKNTYIRTWPGRISVHIWIFPVYFETS